MEIGPAGRHVGSSKSSPSHLLDEATSRRSTHRANSIEMSTAEAKTYVFFVYAPDYTDPDAFNRRLSVRSQHLERMGVLGKKGILRMGGALVSPDTLESDQKKLVGSGMMFEAESADALRKILEEDIYWTSNVWDKEKIVILPFISAGPLPSMVSE